jgi:hypothetical protein
MTTTQTHESLLEICIQNCLVRIVFLHLHSSNPTPTAFRAQIGLPSIGEAFPKGGELSRRD